MIDVTYSPEYAQFKERYYGLKTVVLNGLPVQYRGDEAYIPHHDYTNVTGDGPWKEVIEDIKQKLGVSWIEARLIGARDLAPTPFAAFVLDIPPNSTDETLMNLFPQKLRNVRKGNRSGFTVDFKCFPGELISLYQENMKRHGTPAKSNRFFAELFNAFGERAVAICARKNGQLAGANIIIRGDRDARMIMNLSRQLYWQDRVNDLLYWEMIRYANSFGLSLLDFGGNLISDVSHTRFKLSFGAKMVPILGYTSGSSFRTFVKWFSRKKRNALLRFSR